MPGSYLNCTMVFNVCAAWSLCLRIYVIKIPYDAVWRALINVTSNNLNLLAIWFCCHCPNVSNGVFILEKCCFEHCVWTTGTFLKPCTWWASGWDKSVCVCPLLCLPSAVSPFLPMMTGHQLARRCLTTSWLWNTLHISLQSEPPMSHSLEFRGESDGRGGVGQQGHKRWEEGWASRQTRKVTLPFSHQISRTPVITT